MSSPIHYKTPSTMEGNQNLNNNNKDLVQDAAKKTDPSYKILSQATKEKLDLMNFLKDQEQTFKLNRQVKALTGKAETLTIGDLKVQTTSLEKVPKTDSSKKLELNEVTAKDAKAALEELCPKDLLYKMGIFFEFNGIEITKDIAYHIFNDHADLGNYMIRLSSDPKLFIFDWLELNKTGNRDIFTRRMRLKIDSEKHVYIDARDIKGLIDGFEINSNEKEQNVVHFLKFFDFCAKNGIFLKPISLGAMQSVQKIEFEPASVINPSDEVKETISNIKALPFYYECNREQAEELLKNHEVGTYLVRFIPKNTTYKLAISYVADTKIEHIEFFIEPKGFFVSDGKKFDYLLDTTAHRSTLLSNGLINTMVRHNLLGKALCHES